MQIYKNAKRGSELSHLIAWMSMSLVYLSVGLLQFFNCTCFVIQIFETKVLDEKTDKLEVENRHLVYVIPTCISLVVKLVNFISSM